MTDTQAAVLRYMAQHITRWQRPPTRLEIAQRFGWASCNAADTHLLALARQGHIRMDSSAVGRQAMRYPLIVRWPDGVSASINVGSERGGTEPTTAEQRHPMPADDLQMVVTQQGAVRVNAASVRVAHPDVVLVDVDLHSKYAERFCWATSANDSPEIMLSATDDTLHVDESQPRDKLTIIQFRGLPGWDIHCIGQPGRYTLSVAFAKPREG